jgi:hypothetical protein
MNLRQKDVESLIEVCLGYLREEQNSVNTEARGILHGYADAVPVQSQTQARKEYEKQVSYHRIEADKFLRENPAFDEFIRLIRAGVISLH